MAENSVMIGKIDGEAFETVGRTESWAEQRNITAHIVGRIAALKNKVKPGDSMSDHARWFDGQAENNFYVKTVELASPDGVTGELSLSLVICPQGKNKPFNTTWDIGMEEVQMKLINHPDIIANADVDKLLKWESTPPALRLAKNDKKDKNGKTEGEIKYYYQDVTSQGAGGWQLYEIEGDWNIAYCKAVSQGITTYNRYLPVVTRMSQYLELPGVDYENESHQIVGGTLSLFTAANEIGRYSEPPMGIAGYNNQQGAWFKSMDKFTSAADGTWTRTEAWVFTPDKSAMWIYSGKLENGQ